MTKNKHKSLVKLLLKHTVRTEAPEEPETEEDLNDVIKMCFLNNRSLRLTHRGLGIFSNVFESHIVNLPEDYQLRSRDLITLDRECSLPYYLYANDGSSKRYPGKAFLVLFERELALILKLCDGDLDMIKDMPRDGAF